MSWMEDLWNTKLGVRHFYNTYLFLISLSEYSYVTYPHPLFHPNPQSKFIHINTFKFYHLHESFFNYFSPYDFLFHDFRLYSFWNEIMKNNKMLYMLIKWGIIALSSCLIWFSDILIIRYPKRKQFIRSKNIYWVLTLY